MRPTLGPLPTYGEWTKRMKNVSFKITDNARKMISRLCSDQGQGPLVPEIFWVLPPEGTSEGEWRIGYHPVEVWETCGPDCRFTVDGQNFIITVLSPPLLDLLNGAILDTDESGQTLRFSR